ncbi:MAG: long-chain fatty acid--CoA ligase [Deltaproteobacteria bacterium]|nr:long-chain fatty acid--CoA ligase [Deltaproteobacteria bacterium]
MSVVGDWMGRGATYWPERTAVVDDASGERFTYARMNARADRLATWLRDEAGVRRGDRVATVVHNGVEALDVFFACGKLGAIQVPLNWRLHPEELAALIDQTEPRVVVYSEAFRPDLQTIADDRASVTAWVHLDGEGVPGSTAWGIALDGPSEPVSEPSLDPEDVACLLFTGGTTGLPKAACISYRMIAWNTLNTVIHELERDDITVTHTPLFHTGGLLVYTVPLLTLGGTVVVMRTWDPGRMLEVIERERVTMFFCVPTQFQMLRDHPRFAEADLSSVRFLTSGGAPLPVALIEEWRAVHEVPFKQGFGMTEFGPGVFSMGPEHAVAKAGSIGRPNYHVEARVVGDANRPVPIGEVGELVLRGPSACSGYWNDPEASAAANDDEGWFHTGDLARVDEEGFYFIVDRKKDLFISGGENVYPAEIEQVLRRHPDVALCAVVGMPHPKWGEVGCAFIVPTPGRVANPDAILTWLRDRLAGYKVPKRVEVVDELPLSAQGKVLKRVLRDRR